MLHNQIVFFSCSWTGIQQEFVDHMKECHSSNGEFYTHWQQGVVDFNPNKCCTKFNVIDAFNKKFIFLYMGNETNPNLIFLIYLLGRKVDAEKYMIDFELKDQLRKIKFIESCFSDADDIANVIKDSRCIILPKTLAQSYAKDGQLNFRFVLKKKDNIELENVEKHQHLLHNVYGHTANPQFHVKPQIKSYQSESNLIFPAARSSSNNGTATTNNKPRYRRNSKK